MIDIRKKYRTCGGQPVENLSLRMHDCFPITGSIGEYGNQSWDANGKYYGSGMTSRNDLIEVVAPDVTLESLAAAGFKVRVGLGDKTEYRVELRRGNEAAWGDAKDLPTAVQKAHELWQLSAERDYVTVLYVLPGGGVSTKPSTDAIARKVVRFSAKPGDNE